MSTLAAAVPPKDELKRALHKSLISSFGNENREGQSLYDLIAQQPFFEGLSYHQLHLLAEAGMEMQFEAGQSIFQSGSPANRFYQVLEGKVLLELEMPKRRAIPVQILHQGDTLGWSWLLPPYNLQLSARALVPTRAIFFYGTRIRNQCEQDHELGYELMTRFADVAGQCLKAMQLRLTESCSSYGMTLGNKFAAAA